MCNCNICGEEVEDFAPRIERFGQTFCSSKCRAAFDENNDYGELEDMEFPETTEEVLKDKEDKICH
jgi:YHS domain-containing protein